MKDLKVKTLALPEIKTVVFGRFKDERGYFTETYRQTDFKGLDFMQGVRFTQCNEAVSQKGVVRGLHFQFDPYMGKLVRTLRGHMVDLVLDIRKGSPTFGKIILHDMLADSEKDADEWIWIPPGFAHGNFYPENSAIEYFCTGQYSPNGEVAISPLSEEIDWSLADQKLKKAFDQLMADKPLISEKDKQSMNLSQWQSDPRIEKFVYGQV